MKVEKFKNFLDIDKELSDNICDADSKKPEDADKKHEIGYFYIDFQYLIIGDTIKAMRENREIPKFNDLQYAWVLAKKAEDDSRNQFFMQESIQKLIDSQWEITRSIQ